jgi:hypothetical protein
VSKAALISKNAPAMYIFLSNPYTMLFVIVDILYSSVVEIQIGVVE